MTPTGQPLVFDLYCGMGGWAEGFLSEGYRVIGFDNERHQYGEAKYPGQLVLQDVRTIHGSQLKDADVIVASPPCQRYSYMAMPWDRAKREIRWQQWQRTSPFSPGFDLNDLFEACFRIQREASEAAGHEIPMVVENVKGAQRWVGKASWNFGSMYLWGDVPALMPYGSHRKLAGNNSPRLWSERRVQRLGDALINGTDYAFCLKGSTSVSRKAASAHIAKIPFPLSSHIARVFKP